MEKPLENWECLFCKALTPDDKSNCWNCQKPRDASITANKVADAGIRTPETSSTQPVGSASKYPALETVSTLLGVVAVLVLILSIIAGGVLVLQVGGVAGVGSGIAVAIFGLFQWLFLRAAAESLIVLVDIERNTRIAAEKAVSAV